MQRVTTTTATTNTTTFRHVLNGIHITICHGKLTMPSLQMVFTNMKVIILFNFELFIIFSPDAIRWIPNVHRSRKLGGRDQKQGVISLVDGWRYPNVTSTSSLVSPTPFLKSINWYGRLWDIRFTKVGKCRGFKYSYAVSLVPVVKISVLKMLSWNLN